MTFPNIGWTWESKKDSRTIIPKNHFIETIIEKSQEWAFDKEKIPLFSPALFDVSKNPETPKVRKNVLGTTILALDFDGSQVEPEIISNDFFGDYFHLIYNSFNNGSPNKKPGSRFRVVLPFAEPLLEPTDDSREYEALWDYMTRDLQDKKYELDKTKRGAASFFILPALTPNPIWIAVTDRPLIDPMAVLESDHCVKWWDAKTKAYEAEQAALEAQYATIKKTALTDKQKADRADKALNRHANPSAGHEAFFKYALSLYRHAQMTPPEVEALLRSNADKFGTNTGDRLKEVKHILKKLK